jgi:tetratricopeptide (TPR) repeat protein
MLSLSVLGIAVFCSLGVFGFQSSPATVSLEQARHFYEQRQWGEAEAAASQALAADPRLGDAEVLLGLVFTMRSQFGDAEKHFLRAVTLQPENYRARAYLGATYMQEKRLPEAASAFRKVLEINPENVSASYNLGVIALAGNSPSQALDHFENVVRSNPSDVPALVGAMESQILLRRIPDARRSAKKLGKLLADNDPRLFQAASLLAQHGESAAAIPMMERARQAYPDSYDVNYNLALALLETGQLDRAAGVLQPFAGSGGTAEACDILGQIEERRGHPEAAENAFREAAQRDSTNDDFRFDYGNSLVQHGKLQLATEVFRTAISEYPSSWKLHFGLGSACYLSGDYVRAVQELIETVRLKPDSATAYFLLGEAYDSAGSSQPAIEAALESYLKTAPRDPWAYYHYAVILVSERHGNELGAVDVLHKALQVNPNFAEAHIELGIIALAQGKTDTAIADLEKAVHLAPNLSAAHYRLGLAYQKRGNKERAKAELDRFRTLKNQENQRARVLESLDAVGR